MNVLGIQKKKQPGHCRVHKNIKDWVKICHKSENFWKLMNSSAAIYTLAFMWWQLLACCWGEKARQTTNFLRKEKGQGPWVPRFHLALLCHDKRAFKWFKWSLLQLHPFLVNGEFSAKEKINLPMLVMGGTSGWKRERWEWKGDWIFNEALMNGSSTLAAITQGLRPDMPGRYKKCRLLPHNRFLVRLAPNFSAPDGRGWMAVCRRFMFCLSNSRTSLGGAI